MASIYAHSFFKSIFSLEILYIVTFLVIMNEIIDLIGGHYEPISRPS